MAARSRSRSPVFDVSSSDEEDTFPLLRLPLAAQLPPPSVSTDPGPHPFYYDRRIPLANVRLPLVLVTDPPVPYAIRLAIPVERVPSRGWRLDSWALDPRLESLGVGRICPLCDVVVPWLPLCDWCSRPFGRSMVIEPGEFDVVSDWLFQMDIGDPHHVAWVNVRRNRLREVALWLRLPFQERDEDGTPGPGYPPQAARPGSAQAGPPRASP